MFTNVAIHMSASLLGKLNAPFCFSRGASSDLSRWLSLDGSWEQLGMTAVTLQSADKLRLINGVSGQCHLSPTPLCGSISIHMDIIPIQMNSIMIQIYIISI